MGIATYRIRQVQKTARVDSRRRFPDPTTIPWNKSVSETSSGEKEMKSENIRSIILCDANAQSLGSGTRRYIVLVLGCASNCTVPWYQDSIASQKARGLIVRSK